MGLLIHKWRPFYFCLPLQGYSSMYMFINCFLQVVIWAVFKKGETCPPVVTSVARLVNFTSVGGDVGRIVTSLNKYGPLAVAIHVVSDFHSYR